VRRITPKLARNDIYFSDPLVSTTTCNT
ncbi:LOW QUALITY PROTEIN: hypothetical protein PanWU01x14_326390, partial [Parasponia andersonii]